LKKLNTYLDLCSLYYELDKPTAPQKALSFYMDFAKESKGPILEPMCGNGRFLIPILEAGFDIEGFDASLPMLNILKKKCVRKT
jgi:2-polyprenyl-3-methyl-5-hydroxy-6-metoxy-1,4-benzoquinol methylase